MKTINERFREVRTSLDKKLSQEAFAKEIGLTRSELKNIEYCLTTPKDFTISQVCQKFRINETWLRTGKGEMTQQVNRDAAIAAFMDDVMKSEDADFRRRLVAVLAKLDVSEWELLERMALQLADDAKKEGQAYHPANNNLRVASPIILPTFDNQEEADNIN